MGLNPFSFESNAYYPFFLAKKLGILNKFAKSLNNNYEPDLDDVPIASRKGTHSCTKYPISHFMTTKHLSI